MSAPNVCLAFPYCLHEECVSAVSQSAGLDLDSRVARWMRYYGHVAAEPSPQYSTDMAAALLVLEQLAMPGFRVCIECAGCGDYTLVWEVRADDDINAKWEMLAEISESPSLPLAICWATQEHPTADVRSRATP